MRSSSFPSPESARLAQPLTRMGVFLEVTPDKTEAAARMGFGSFYAIKGAGFEIHSKDHSTRIKYMYIYNHIHPEQTPFNP